MNETLISPRPPSTIRIMASGMNNSGQCSLRNENAINIPIALEPASPIRSLLGDALNHR